MKKEVFAICFLAICWHGILPAASLAGSPDSVPEPPPKPYYTWIDVAKMGQSGNSVWQGRYKGVLRGIEDSSLVFETSDPSAGWQKTGFFYKVPVSDVERIAFRRVNAPRDKIWLSILSGTALGIVWGIIRADSENRNASGGYERDFNRAAYTVMGSITGLLVGVTVGLSIGFRKKKTWVQRNQNTFDSNREMMKKYIRN